MKTALRRAPAARDRRFAVWIGTTAVLFVAALLVGFVWLPAAQAGRDGSDLWSAICSAIGLPGRDAGSGAASDGKAASEVAWTAATQALLARGNAARGAGLAAASCNGCHGRAGVSDDAIFPNLAGQGAASVYKQLRDFKSGLRDAAVMGGYVAGLSDDDLRDLAAHYASLPAATAQAPGPAAGAHPDVEVASRRLVIFGDPMRGIPACAACHGPAGHVVAAPPLQGQQRAYLEVQLQAFAEGRRHNDISAQMRGVARALTAQEIAGLAAYYAAAPGDPATPQPAPDPAARRRRRRRHPPDARRGAIHVPTCTGRGEVAHSRRRCQCTGAWRRPGSPRIPRTHHDRTHRIHHR